MGGLVFNQLMFQLQKQNGKIEKKVDDVRKIVKKNDSNIERIKQYLAPNIFEREDVKFEIFKKLVKNGSIVRALVTKNTKDKPRSFFDSIDRWAKEQGSSGLAYFTLEKDDKINAKGPIGKFFSENALLEIMKLTNANIGDTVFLSCGKKNDVEKILSVARNKIAEDLNLIDNDPFSTDLEEIPVFVKMKKVPPYVVNQIQTFQLGQYNDNIFGRSDAVYFSQISLETPGPTFGIFNQNDEINGIEILQTNLSAEKNIFLATNVGLFLGKISTNLKDPNNWNRGFCCFDDGPIKAMTRYEDGLAFILGSMAVSYTHLTLPTKA